MSVLLTASMGEMEPDDNKTYTPPPIAGYRPLSQQEVDLMNECKAVGAQVEALVEHLRATAGVDMRWLAIGTTDLQRGLMALCRAIAKPKGF